jgi:hypothetical protein
MTMAMSRALIQAMTGCEIPWETSCGRMNRECGDIVSRAEACAASADNGLVCHFGNTDVATAEALLNSLDLETINLRAVHMDKTVGDKCVKYNKPRCASVFITPRIATTVTGGTCRDHPSACYVYIQTR